MLLILGSAAWLRFKDLGREGLWLDELFSLQSSAGRGSASERVPHNVWLDNPAPVTPLDGAGPWWTIWTSQGGEVHPPLYYMLLRGWRELFGDGDAALRVPSVLMSLAVVWLVYVIGKMHHGPDVALWACALMAVAAPQIQYAQEARPYAMLTLMCLIACWAVLAVEHRGYTRRRAATFAVAWGVMMLTQYTALAPVAALVVYALVRLRGDARRRMLLALVAVATVVAVAWGPFLWEQLSAPTPSDWMQEDPDGHVVRALSRIATAPLRLLAQPPSTTSALVLGMGLLWYILPIFLLRRRPDLLIWCLVGGPAIAQAAVPDLLRPASHLAIVRYFILAAPALYLLIAAMTSHFRPRIRHLLPATVLLYCVVSLGEAFPRMKEDWREVAQVIASGSHPGEPVILGVPPPTLGIGNLFIGTSHYMRTYPGPVLLATSPLTPDLMRRLDGQESAWLLMGWIIVPLDEFVPRWKPIWVR
ncbi:MAG: glycosyltransferase family 39 protein, partial [Tepidisphaeraceae bacterium]